MPKLRPELERVLTGLLAASADTRTIALDAIGAALGTLAVSTDDIDALLSALESHGREISAPSGGGSELHLRRVVLAARALKIKLERRATLADVATEAELSQEQVLVALALLRVMQR